jgi:vancomycin resistance protein YoaR
MRAFDEFGVTILQPSQSFNVNKLLAWLDGYCTGTGEREYMFYQGVCGFSTQVWRNALINPYLTTTRRAPHSSWWQAYYGEEIVWDDAAIYEMDKQLEIQNTSEYPIYMRTIERAWRKYLISVMPKIADKAVTITRINTWPLQWTLTRIIKDKDSGELIDADQYVSQYYGVVKGSN